MSEEKELKQAKAVFKSICDMLDENKWHYEKSEQDLTIETSARGDDLPMGLKIEVDKERSLVILLSPMPFEIPENRRAALAIAVSRANNGMIDGSFDYNFLNGRIVFRMTTSYFESLLGKETFEYMLFVSCNTIDEYNDKFLMVAKNDMTAQQILDLIK